MAQTSEFYTKEGVDTEVKKVADELAETKTTFNAKIEKLGEDVTNKLPYTIINDNLDIVEYHVYKITDMYFFHIVFKRKDTSKNLNGYLITIPSKINRTHNHVFPVCRGDSKNGLFGVYVGMFGYFVAPNTFWLSSSAFDGVTANVQCDIEFCCYMEGDL